ncbi:hypothetical protein MNEG_16120 [Monoraphidium neglectum]|uniref:Uncharacterized protein n=1 Tax=Monoraphidium neglectum TaxID=145388 RepID=A0A0D2IV50_9CHLO|nr:hypothetical protein MNEG_16120 [Monoraphidium neglectum]KIY91842.1 hypothetical protein MNEG_16120 [Monoraphidium neglectum]|eukprot:XP_013890862.1 hypothetical protein MNEG_16120 [Monoraphidium neglectum]
MRLLVRATHADGRALRVRPATSTPFVVATRRVRNDLKADIASVDDPVGTLLHMGRETIRKLKNLRTAAEQAGKEINIPENRVVKVGDFQALVRRADQDGHLRQQLRCVLKLSEDKWKEARERALRAVVPDNRMRAWYANRR